MLSRTLLNDTRRTMCPARPVTDEVMEHLRATILLIETFWTDPGTRGSRPRPRFPSRIKIGVSTPDIETFEITTPSILAPSTDSSDMPERGRRPLSRGDIVQFENETSLKSPLLSVPNLKLLQLVRSTQLVTVRCSTARFAFMPIEGLAFGQIASSHDSM